MKVEIANHDCTIIWDGVYYFALSDYPNISSWELGKLLDFINYEKQHGRETEIICDNEDILAAVHAAIANPKSVEDASLPTKITECTHCRQGGCLTEYVCHTATIDSAKKIFADGKLLSAIKAFGKSGEELVKDPRNAASDPPDFFEYIMFAYGNCQAGDRLVMERTLERSPTDDELEKHLTPGVRFYFRRDNIVKHPGYVFDGYHPAKIKDELVLDDYLFAAVIPEQSMDTLAGWIPMNLIDRVYYLSQDGLGILDWSKRVYDFVCAL